jgi:hypothetical protein
MKLVLVKDTKNRKVHMEDSLVLTVAFVLVACGPAVTSAPKTVASAHHADATMMGAIALVLDEILREPILTF